MRESVEISKELVNYLRGRKMDGVRYFNPVLNSVGKWVISKGEQEMCVGVEYDFLKTLPSKEHIAMNEAVDLSDVFNSNNIYSSDIEQVLNVIDSGHRLQRKDIRFRGLEIPEQAKEVSKRLIQDGFIFLESDLPNGTPEDGAEIIDPVIREDGIMEIGQKGNANKKVFAAMYHKDQIDIGVGQITTTPANFIEGILPNDWIGLGSEVSLEALKSELNNRGKNVL